MAASLNPCAGDRMTVSMPATTIGDACASGITPASTATRVITTISDSVFAERSATATAAAQSALQQDHERKMHDDERDEEDRDQRESVDARHDRLEVEFHPARQKEERDQEPEPD